MILATDLALGPKYVTSFQTMVDSSVNFDREDEVKLLLQVMIKCADVSHAAKPLRMHKYWSVLITEEFFKQVGRVSTCHIFLPEGFGNRGTWSGR